MFLNKMRVRKTERVDPLRRSSPPPNFHPRWTRVRNGARLHPSRYQTVYPTGLLFTRKKPSGERRRRRPGKRFFRRRFPLRISNDAKRAVDVERFSTAGPSFLFHPYPAGETVRPPTPPLLWAEMNYKSRVPFASRAFFRNRCLNDRPKKRGN